MSRLLATAALLLALLPAAAQAEAAPVTAPSAGSDAAAADLARMREKAAGNPRLQALLDSLLRQSSTMQPQQRFAQMLRYSATGLRDGITRPIAVSMPEEMQAAQARASAMQRILVADLNGDWQVSADEVRAVLSLRPTTGPAEALVLFDTDKDGVLSTDEIHRAAEALAERSSATRTNPLVLIDFDNDGTVTPEEYQRALAALPG